MPKAKTNAEEKEVRQKIEIPPGRYGNTEGCPCIDMYALAEEIYKLMKRDLRLERERLGRS
jgi:hypothetical protein